MDNLGLPTNIFGNGTYSGCPVNTLKMEDVFGRVAKYEIRCALYDFDSTHMGCFYNFPKSIQTEATRKGCKALVSTENYLDGSLVRCVSFCESADFYLNINLTFVNTLSFLLFLIVVSFKLFRNHFPE